MKGRVIRVKGELFEVETSGQRFYVAGDASVGALVGGLFGLGVGIWIVVSTRRSSEEG